MAEKFQALDEKEPDYDDWESCPKTLTRNRHIDGIFYVAGRAPIEDQIEYDVMFVTTSVDEEEATTMKQTVFGYTMRQPAEYLRGPTGMIKDVALRCHLDLDKCYYTALCKWLIPRTKRSKPSKKVLNWGLPVLMDEIKRVKPKIIVCLGKPVFDMLSDTKIGFDDAHGGWFWSSEANAHLYVTHSPGALIGKPDLYEVFRVDFQEVERKRRILEGGDINDVPVRFEVLRSEQQLRDWLSLMEEADPWPGITDDNGNKILSVDCEWHGRTHVDGNLRSIQFAWTESDAVVVEFRDEQNEWIFQIDEELEDDLPDAFERKRYAYIGKLLGRFCNRKDVRYVGHHFSADSPWMLTWLNLDVYQRCVMDTEFAQQTVDEASELKLERGIGMKYTTLGLYNQDLLMWKRENRALCKDGYGYIPSAILHPYGARDVIVPLRAYPHIKRQLQAQQLWEYYKKLHNPFVTDVFTEFCVGGLPMDIPLMDDLRRLFHFVRQQLEVHLKHRIHSEAKAHVANRLMALIPLRDALKLSREVYAKETTEEAYNLLKPHVPLSDLPQWQKMLQHLYDSPNFNIRSADQMRTWLFDVEDLEPIKTTNQKAKGLPSMAWEKVLELPPDRQKLYTPAVDKQTLQILSEQCPTVDELLNLNAVGNLCKAFLKEADVWIDPETGEEEIEEHGLHQWVASDGRIHGQMSCTGTSRPRSWAPNTLNYPAYVNARIAKTVVRVINEAHSKGELPEELMRWVGCDEKSLPSIRSCINSPHNYVLCESDYKTAEMHGLGVISGDEDLIRILQDPDPEWAELKDPKKFGVEYVRVCYSDPSETGIPLHKQNPEYVMAAWKDGKFLGKVSEDDLARNPDGTVKHRGYDIHWSVVERTYERPREEMINKVHRNAGKVLNFCVDGDSMVLTRDRGSVAICDIKVDDLVWDGVEWVRHEGVIYSGRKKIIEYQGLRATRLHDVWTVERGKVKFEEACAESLTLVRTASEGQSVAVAWSEASTEFAGTQGIGLLLRLDPVLALREGALEGTEEHGDRKVVKVSVSEPSAEPCEIPGERSSGNLVSDAKVCSNETALRDGHACVVASVSGSRNQGQVSAQGGVHSLGASIHRSADHGGGLRQEGQRRGLLPGKPEVGRSINQPDEQAVGSSSQLPSGKSVSSGPPSRSVHLEDHSGPHEDGALERRDFDEACEQYCCGEAETYDLLNAGPRHRFTCSGVLVSNSSAYGASPASLERKIESDTGVKPEPGTGQKGLDAIAARQPRASEFLEEMGNVPKTKGYYRAVSGRICHCNTHSANSGVGWRTRNSIESALGRELRNYPMQESVGATSARACNYALALYRQLGMKARPMTCLYDSLVTLCPLEERFVVAKIHTIVMSEINTWEYNDEFGKRVLQYGVDNEFNYRWSTRPSAEEQAQLDDVNWHPTPERLKKLLAFRNWKLLVS